MHPLLHLYLFHLHVFFSVWFFVGVGLTYSWIKTLPSPQRKYWTFRILIFGTLGTALTVPFCIVGIRVLMP